VGNRAEIFGSLRTITRIDRDTRPLFFEGINDKGTGGGIVPDHPLVNSEWTGNKIGDLWLGGKVNLTPDAPAAFALRGMVKLPMGDDGSGASSGKLDGQVDVIVSHANDAVELSGFGGILMRGSPDGYELTNGLRWGVGAAFPQRGLGGLRINAELFGERYFDDTITAPEGLTGSDGSIVPTRTQLRSPAVALLGLTWQAPNGFFVGAAGTWNLTMAGRSDAGPEFSDYPRDDKGFQVRIGWHPGARRQAIQPPPPPPPAAAGRAAREPSADGQGVLRPVRGRGGSHVDADRRRAGSRWRSAHLPVEDPGRHGGQPDAAADAVDRAESAGPGARHRHGRRRPRRDGERHGHDQRRAAA